MVQSEQVRFSVACSTIAHLRDEYFMQSFALVASVRCSLKGSVARGRLGFC